MNVVLLVLVVIRFSVPYNFVNTQPIVIKLCADICDHIPYQRTVSDLKLSPN